MPASPIRKLVPFADKAKKAGKTVYHLNIGQPDIQTPDVVLNALRNMDDKVIAYSHSAGIPEFREGLANYYKAYDIHVTADDMVVTTGGSEALLFAFKTCLNPGDEVIVPEPFYANYNGFAVDAGIVLRPITTHVDEGFTLPGFDAFEKLVNENTRGVLINAPGNPTGYLNTREELEVLRDIVKRHDLFLFSDEVYREFTYDGLEPTSAMHLEGIEDNVVMIDSVSKRYSLCGARVGALVSKNRDLVETAHKFGQARLSPPTLGQKAAIAALDTPNEYFEEVTREYVKRRDILVDGLREIEGVKCPRPGGAFYVMAELPVDSAEEFCKWLLSDFDHNGQTVMMAPGHGFYVTPGRGTREVRIAYVLEENALRNAVECLQLGLKEYAGKLATP